ncbi:DUF1569 domain-containing protein [Maribacter sp. MMG018]|uniref:DUF1569 domain-containing protein n=1 Tax=Maribacter sp. MMG018 TaxID=2822688 RepID=UPI001B372022|nr:DUF1569 domain-containing protein [Maribacter sp. MMG018]MBQ4916286.1 DUF1569 domain-containing protein [Maribacter sp. MMG018]
MAWKNLFDKTASEETIERINSLTPEKNPKWGKMNASQMLAHCNVSYELVYTDKHKKPKGFQKFLIKLFAKNIVVGPKPYKKNSRTSPIFIINDERDFESERNRLIAHIQKTQQLGSEYFNGKESHAFGKLNDKEWNVLFSKHLDHHLQQFDV